MSAGGLSYSGLVSYGATTLPSVESWGTNMNILRDPPKSIMTRRIDKVGETSSITEMIDASGDRAAEAIMVYPRGVNTMVSVSYSNYGNNGGGGQAGSLTGLSQSFTSLPGSNSQSFLPYRVMNGQSFRPPIQSPQDLMPLSRQPRVWTSQFTTPGFVDFSKKLIDQGSACQTKEVKTELLKTFVRPTAYKQIEKPIEKPTNVKYSIQKAMKVSAHSGNRTMDLTQQYVIEPSSGVYDNTMHVNVKANSSDRKKYVNNTDVNTLRYIQDANPHSVGTNTSQSKQVKIDHVIDPTKKYIQNAHVIDHTAPLSIQGDGTKYIHNSLERDRVLPKYQSSTNKMDSRIHKSIQHTNDIYLDKNIPTSNFESRGFIRRTEDPNGKEKKIIPKISPGSFMINNSAKPLTNRIQQIPVLQENEKTRMSKFVAGEMNDRRF